MSNSNIKYKSVEQIAFRDIAEYHRKLIKEKPAGFDNDYFVSSKLLFTKETRRLNRQLGLHLINKNRKNKYNGN